MFKITKSVRRPLPPRRVTPEEFEAWFEAADARIRPHDVDLATLRTYLQTKYPRRWARLKSDSDWMARKLVKLGINDEDAKSALWWML